jgi:hypothetical protein
MSLETPIKIRMLQRKLYQKAKGEPNYRFYLLYDKMYREDILAHAYALVKSNAGAPGVDNQSFWGIETVGLEDWLNGLREELRAKTYKPRDKSTAVLFPSATSKERANKKTYDSCPGPIGSEGDRLQSSQLSDRRKAHKAGASSEVKNTRPLSN